MLEIVVPQGDILWTLLMIIGIAVPIAVLVLLVILVVISRRVLRIVSEDNSVLEKD